MHARCARLSRLMSVAGLALVGLAACTPKPHALYEQVRQRYGSAQTLRSEGTLRIEAAHPVSNETTTVELRTQLAARRPNQLRAEVQPVGDTSDAFIPVTLISTGEKLVLIQHDQPSTTAGDEAAEGEADDVEAPLPNPILEADAGADLAAMDPTVTGLGGMLTSPDYAFFAGTLPELGEDAVSLQPEAVTVAGVPCHVLQIKFPAPRAMEATVAVGKRDFLIRQVALKQPTGEQATWTYETMELGPTLQDSVFAHQPQPDQEVWSGKTIAEALQNGMAGDMSSVEDLTGEPAPRVTVQPLAGGEPVSLTELADGQPLVVDFWATWCPPCKVYLPVLQRIAEDYAGRVQFAMVSDEDAATVKPFIEQEQVTLPQYLDPGAKANQAFGVTGIPTTAVIAPDGTVRWLHAGASDGEELREVLDELVAGEA